MSLLGIPFDVVEPVFTERIRPDLSPLDHALLFAESKAQNCPGRFAESLILGSDTLIELDGKILGKPNSLADAGRMLRRLSGREHRIHTAVAIADRATGSCRTAVETVRVWFKPVSDADVERYLQIGESMGKAGAYAIQGYGGDLIERIEGDYPAAVGLPLRLVSRILQDQGMKIPISIETLYRERPYPNWVRFAR
ncbi:MAG: Maf family protein [Nitrospiraceae bacterium]